MRAELKGVEGFDREEPETYVSLDPTNDAFWLRLLVGPKGEPGEESFDVLVCTPTWLAGIIAEQGPQVGSHRLIVQSIDLSTAETFLRDRIERLEAPSWGELAAKVARLGYWEFEDYRR